MAPGNPVERISPTKQGSQSNLGRKILGTLRSVDMNTVKETRHFKFHEASKLYSEFRNICRPKKTLDKANFKDAIGFLGMSDDSILFERLFSMFNKSKSGEITFDEYIEGLGILLKGGSEEKLDFAFALTDIDGSGDITLDEIMKTVESMVQLYSTALGHVPSPEMMQKRKERMGKIFQRMDTDKDGMITLEEYKQGMLSNPEFAALISGSERYVSKEEAKIQTLEKRLEFYKRVSSAMELGINRLIYMAEQSVPAETENRAEETPEKTKVEDPVETKLSSEETVYHSILNASSEETASGKEDLSDFLPSLLELKQMLGLMATPTFPSNQDLISNPVLKKFRPHIKSRRRVIRKSKGTASPLNNLNSHSQADLSDFMYTSDNEYTDVDKHSESGLSRSISTKVVENVAEKEAKTARKKSLAILKSEQPAPGKTVHFGHKNWGLVLNVMKGIQMAVIRSLAEPYRSLGVFDFSVKEKYTLASDKSKGTKKNMKSCRFIDYAPFVFRCLRESFGIKHQDYISSIGLGNVLSNIMLGSWSSLQEQGSEGKSGSFFYITSDGQFLIKTVHREEHKIFRSILPEYYQHMSQKSKEPKSDIPSSLLTWILGCHVIRTTKSSKFRAEKIYLVVMNNVFNTTNHLDYRFDLKGSRTGRKHNEAIRKQHTKTLKDLDFTEMGFKLKLKPEDRSRLVQVLKRDSLFLEKRGLIDYSLLVGIHDVKESDAAQKESGSVLSSDGKSVYYIGLLDFLTPYTKRKVCERVFKTMQHWDPDGISVQPPKRYSKRFMHFIETILDKENQ